ncbi:MAG: hypothetical protein ACRYFX_17385 [Janthinobacterium lividum]
MRYLLLLLALMARLAAQGQQLIHLSQGDFIDTVQTRPAVCPAPVGYRYYMVGGKYPRSSATLVQQAQAFLQQRGAAYGGSGFVTFRFIIDCQGHRQRRTQVLQTDPHYQPCQFAPPLLATLYAYLQTLTEWKAATNKAGEPLQYIAYLTFKLQDGEVVAVAP